MNFLAPLFLLGAIAVIGPVIFHLIRRTTREKTPFSTLMFLDPTPPRITRRSRLENLWLLLLRCLVIGLLATAFARPFFRQEASNAASPSGKQRAVVLIDTSASMRRDGIWTAAVKKATEQIRRAEAGDELALLAFDRSVRPLMTFEDWNGLRPDERPEIAVQRLNGVSPTWFGTQLDSAMIRAAEVLDAKGETEPIDRKIIVVSDLQEGAALDRLQGYEWPRGTSVEFISVGQAQPNNVSLHWVPEGEESKTTAEAPPLRLRVTNSPANKREQFGIHWVEQAQQSSRVGGGSSDPAEISPDRAPGDKNIPAYVPAGQTRIVRIPSPAGTGSAAQTSLRIEGDEIPFDNTVHLLPPQPIRIPILFLGKEPANDSQGLLYFLHRAFPKTRGQDIEIIAHASQDSVPAFQSQAAQLLVLGEEPGAPSINAAREAAISGRVVVVPLLSPESASSLAALLEGAAPTVTEAPVKDYALLGKIDFQHPLFAPFSDPRFSDFTKIHFWKYRRVDPSTLPGARVIAEFDRGDPAVLQIPLGRGSVVVIASSWKPADSQLALSSKFVPLLHALLEQSTDIPPTKAQYFVGDIIPMSSSTTGYAVRKPDGTEVRIDSGEPFAATDQPGIYAVSPGGRRFVVNLSPEESRLTPLPLDRFSAMGIPLQKPEVDPKIAAQRANAAQAFEIEGRQKVWRWLIATALGVLLLETLIAGKLSGANRSSTVPTP
jgi:Aerotolerance regulator N-terminal/von Willebrand factor type A domain